MKKLNLEHTFVYGTLGIIAITGSLFTYTLVSPIDVLKDWKLETQKKSYSVGDTIIATSSYNKILSVNGQSKRYIECLSPTGAWNRYPVLEKPADTAKGKGRVETHTVIPSTVPNVSTKCRLYINVEYIIYRYRPYREEGISNEFELVKKEGIAKIPQAPVSSPLPTVSNIGPQVTLPPNMRTEPQPSVDGLPAIITQENPEARQPFAIEQVIQNVINAIKSAIGGI